MAHLVETHLQMTGRAGQRQVRDALIALLHGDGGVLSSHAIGDEVAARYQPFAEGWFHILSSVKNTQVVDLES